VLSFIAFTAACIAVAEWILRFHPKHSELARKFIHTSSACTIAAYPLFGISFQDLAIVAVGFIIALLAARKVNGLHFVSGVKRHSYGELYMPLSVLLLSFFDLGYPILAACYLTLGFSDACACLVGQGVKSPAYRLFGSGKSVAGTSAFLLTATPIVLLCLYLSGQPLDARLFISGAIVAAGAALAEAVGNAGSDNLFIPLSIAFSLHLLT
jgi:phytol kinase